MPAQSLPVKYTQLFINNQYTNSANDKTYTIVNTTTDEVICGIQDATKLDVDKAVLAAKNAFKSNSVWRKMNAKVRGSLLDKMSDLIEVNIDYVAGLEQLTNGNVYTTAYKQVKLAVHYLRYIALMSTKLFGKEIPIVGPYFAFTRLEPIGVCGAVLNNNISLVLTIIQIGVALAAGNTIVIKAAEQKPLIALYLGSIVAEAGFPPGVVNIITGSGINIWTAISEHSFIKNIALFGSRYAINQQENVTDSTKCERFAIEMLPAVGFHSENNEPTFNKEGEQLDKFVKLSIELAAKRFLCRPYDSNRQHEFQIDGMHLSKIVSYIVLYTKKTILL